MGICKLTEDYSLTGCEGISYGGTTGLLYLIDFAAWQRATIVRHGDRANTTIQSIQLTKTGDKAVEYTLPLNNITPTAEPVRNASGHNGYKHNIVFFLPEITNERRLELHSLYNYGRTVALVVTASQEICNVYGSGAGLVLLSDVETPADPNMGGGATITLGTGETGIEAMPCGTFQVPGDTNVREDTLAALIALKTPKA